MPLTLANPDTLQDLLLFRLSRLLSTAGTPVIRLCEGELGITWREWRVIASLRPSVTMLSSELARHTQLDRARTSRCISSLLEKGLIHRQPVPGDMRKATVSLTDKGCAVYASFFPVVLALNARLLQSLNADQMAILDSTLTQVQAAADAMQADTNLPKANRRQGGRRRTQ